MSDPWLRLQTAAGNAIDWIWGTLAKNGQETAALAPLAESPKAAGHFGVFDDKSKLVSVMGLWQRLHHKSDGMVEHCDVSE